MNVGVWHGFSLLAAIAGNDDKVCVGVDNFSEFGGPRDEFLRRFLDRRSPQHRFYNQTTRTSSPRVSIIQSGRTSTTARMATNTSTAA